MLWSILLHKSIGKGDIHSEPSYMLAIETFEDILKHVH